jgi:hypothetical protein
MENNTFKHWMTVWVCPKSDIVSVEEKMFASTSNRIPISSSTIPKTSNLPTELFQL